MNQMETLRKYFDLSGKVAIITGGSRGLGLEMSRAFAAVGARVVIASRKQEACDAAARDVGKESGQECLGVAYHAGNWADGDRLADLAYDRFGRVDVLVVNLRGPFRLSALVGERMAAGDGGSIINVSSIAAVQPTPTELPYGMAKAGLNALTLGLARAYAPKVRVNCIMPGPFLTDISKAWDMEAFQKRAETGIPLRRGGEPDEVVGAALYYACAASSYTTGSILKIDGGSAYPAA